MVGEKAEPTLTRRGLYATQQIRSSQPLAIPRRTISQKEAPPISRQPPVIEGYLEILVP